MKTSLSYKIFKTLGVIYGLILLVAGGLLSVPVSLVLVAYRIGRNVANSAVK